MLLSELIFNYNKTHDGMIILTATVVLNTHVNHHKAGPPSQTRDNRFKHLTHLYGARKKTTREWNKIHSNFTSFITKSIISRRPAAVSQGVWKVWTE